eukprot:scpid69825/ scgid5542/ 
MQGLGVTGAALGKSCLATISRRLQHGTAFALETCSSPLKFGNVVLKKCPEQEYLHGPPDWNPQLKVADPLKPCEPADFTLEFHSSSLAVYDTCRYDMQPSTPPWWPLATAGVPDYIHSLLSSLQLAEWDSLSKEVSDSLNAQTPSTSYVFWELLMWQAIRLTDVDLASRLIYAARRRVISFQPKLMLLFSVAVARSGGLKVAVKYYQQCDLSLSSKALVVYATEQMLEMCNEVEETTTIFEHFANNFSVNVEELSDVRHFVGQHKLPREDLLCYLLDIQSIPLLLAFTSVLGMSQQNAAQLVITTIAPNVFSPSVMHRLLSEFIIYELSKRQNVASALMFWKTFTQGGVKLSATCTARLLNTLAAKPDSELFFTAFTVIDHLHCVDFSRDNENEVCLLLSAVGKVQAIVKNRIAASGPIPPGVWDVVFKKVLPLDVLGTLKMNDVWINMVTLNVKYAIEASDLRGRHPEVVDAIRDSGLRQWSNAFWRWSALTHRGLHPLSCYVVGIFIIKKIILMSKSFSLPLLNA